MNLDELQIKISIELDDLNKQLKTVTKGIDKALGPKATKKLMADNNKIIKSGLTSINKTTLNLVKKSRKDTTKEIEAMSKDITKTLNKAFDVSFTKLNSNITSAMNQAKMTVRSACNDIRRELNAALNINGNIRVTSKTSITGSVTGSSGSNAASSISSGQYIGAMIIKATNAVIANNNANTTRLEHAIDNLGNKLTSAIKGMNINTNNDDVVKAINNLGKALGKKGGYRVKPRKPQQQEQEENLPAVIPQETKAKPKKKIQMGTKSNGRPTNYSRVDSGIFFTLEQLNHKVNFILGEVTDTGAFLKALQEALKQSVKATNIYNRFMDDISKSINIKRLGTGSYGNEIVKSNNSPGASINKDTNTNKNKEYFTGEIINPGVIPTQVSKQLQNIIEVSYRVLDLEKNALKNTANFDIFGSGKLDTSQVDAMTQAFKDTHNIRKQSRIPRLNEPAEDYDASEFMVNELHRQVASLMDMAQELNEAFHQTPMGIDEAVQQANFLEEALNAVLEGSKDLTSLSPQIAKGFEFARDILNQMTPGIRALANEIRNFTKPQAPAGLPALEWQDINGSRPEFPDSAEKIEFEWNEVNPSEKPQIPESAIIDVEWKDVDNVEEDITKVNKTLTETKKLISDLSKINPDFNSKDPRLSQAQQSISKMIDHIGPLKSKVAMPGSKNSPIKDTKKQGPSYVFTDKQLPNNNVFQGAINNSAGVVEQVNATMQKIRNIMANAENQDLIKEIEDSVDFMLLLIDPIEEGLAQLAKGIVEELLGLVDSPLYDDLQKKIKQVQKQLNGESLPSNVKKTSSNNNAEHNLNDLKKLTSDLSKITPDLNAENGMKDYHRKQMNTILDANAKEVGAFTSKTDLSKLKDLQAKIREISDEVATLVSELSCIDAVWEEFNSVDDVKKTLDELLAKLDILDADAIDIKLDTEGIKEAQAELETLRDMCESMAEAAKKGVNGFKDLFVFQNDSPDEGDLPPVPPRHSKPTNEANKSKSGKPPKPTIMGFGFGAYKNEIDTLIEYAKKAGARIIEALFNSNSQNLGFAPYQNELHELGQLAKKIGAGIKKALKGAFNVNVGPKKLDRALTVLGYSVSSVANKIKTKMGSVGTYLKAIGKVMTEPMRKSIRKIGKEFDYVPRLAKLGMNRTSALVKSYSSVIRNHLNKAFTGIKSSKLYTSVSTGLNKAKSAVSKFSGKVKPILNKAFNGIGAIPKVASNIGKGLSKAKGVLNKFANSCKTIWGKIRSIFNKGAKDASMATGRLTTGLKSLIANFGSMFGLYQLGRIFVDGTKQAIQYEAALMTMKRTLGGASKSLIDFANNSAQAFGISKSQVMEFGNIYSVIVSNFESDATKAANTTKKLLQSAGVIAGATGYDVNTVLENLRSGILGSSEAVDQLGLNLKVRSLEASESFKRIANGAKSWNDLTEAQKQAIIAQEIINQTTAKYGGIVKNTSSMHNAFMAQLSNTKLALGQLGKALYTAILPALTKIMAVLEKVFTYAAQAVTKFLSLFGITVDFASSMSSAEGTLGDSVSDSFDDTAESVDKATDSVEKFKGSLMGFDEINVLTDNTNKNEDDSSGDSEAMPGVGDLGDLEAPELSETENVFDKLGNKLQAFLSEVLEPFKAAWDNLGDRWKAEWADLIDSFKHFCDSLATFLKSVWEHGGKEFVQHMAEIALAVGIAAMEIGGEILDSLARLWEHLDPSKNMNTKGFLDALNEVSQKLRDFILGLGDHFESLMANGGQDVLNALGDCFMNLGEAAVRGIGIAIDALDGLLDHTDPANNKITRGMLKAWEDAFHSIGQMALDFVGLMESIMANGGQDVLNAMADTFNSLLGLIGTLVDEGAKALSGLFKHLDPSTNEYTKGMLTAWKGAFESLTKMFGEFGELISSTMKNGGQEIINSLGDLGMNISKAIGVFVDEIAKAMSELFDHMDPAKNKNSKDMLKSFDKLVDSVNDFVTAITKYFQKFMDSGGREFVKNLGDIVAIVLDLAAAIGSGIIDIITGFMNSWAGQALIEGAAKALEWFSDKLEGLKAVIEPLKDVFQDVVDFIVGIFEGDGEKVGRAFVSFVKNALKVGLELSKFMGEIGEALILGLIEGIKALPGLLWECIKFIFDLIVGAFKELFGIHSPSTVMADLGVNLIEGLIEGIKNMITSVVDALGAIKDAIFGWFEGILSSASENWNTLCEVTSGKWDEIKESITNFCQGTFDNVSEKWKEIKENVSEKCKEIFDDTKEKWTNIKDNVSETISNLKDDASDKYNELKDTLTDTMDKWRQNSEEKWNKIKDKTSDLVSKLKSDTEDKYNKFKEALTDTMDKWRQNSEEKWNKIKDKADDLVSNLKSNIEDKYSKFRDKLTDTMDKWRQNSEEKWTKIKDKTTELVTNLKDTVEDKYTKFKDNLTDTMDKWRSNSEDKWNNIKSKTSELVSNLKSDTETKYNNMKEALNSKIESVRSTSEAAWKNIKDKASEHISNLKSDVESKYETLKTNLTNKLESWRSTSEDKWNNIKEKGVNAIEDIRKNGEEKFESLKTAVTTKMETIKTDLVSKWETVKNKAVEYVNSMKSDVENKYNDLKTKIGAKLEEVKSETISKWENIKSTASTKIKEVVDTAASKFGEMKSSFTSKMDEVKNALTPKWTELKNSVKTNASGLGDKVTEGLSGLKNKFTKPFEDAKKAISDAISGIGRTISNANWSLPKIKLPHFKISGSFSLNPPSTPKFSVEWYKRGGIIDGITPLGFTGGTMHMGGEAGKEMVVPLENTSFTSKIAQAMGQAVDNAMARNMNSMYGSSANNSNDSKDIVLKVNERELARASINSINKLQRESGRTLLDI